MEEKKKKRKKYKVYSSEERAFRKLSVAPKT